MKSLKSANFGFLNMNSYSCIPRMLLVWICVAAVIVSGQTASPEATTKITEITAQFQAAYDRDVGNPHTAALDAL